MNRLISTLSNLRETMTMIHSSARVLMYARGEERSLFLFVHELVLIFFFWLP
jgi:hypothetical protein